MISQLVELLNGDIGVIVRIDGSGDYQEFTVNTKRGAVIVYHWDFTYVFI